jgi:hypothetical protein
MQIVVIGEIDEIRRPEPNYGGAVRRAELERGLLAAGDCCDGTAVLILALSHSFIFELFAELLHGLTAGIYDSAGKKGNDQVHLAWRPLA